MQIVAIFNPATDTSDTFTVPQSSANGKMVVYNESNISLQFTFQNGHTAYVPAWTAVLFAGPFGNVNVTWAQQTILSGAGQAPLSQVVVETYDCHEPVPGTFPAPLVRQANVGNSLNLSTSTTSIVNDGNAAGTQIVEATPSGDASSAVKLTNDGKLTIGNATHPGQISLDNGKITSDGSGDLTVGGTLSATGNTFLSGTLAVTSNSSFSNGNVTIDTSGNVTIPNNTSYGIKDSGGTGRGIITLNASNEAQMHGITGNGALTLWSDSNAILKILGGSSGVQLLTGTFQLLAGSVSRMTVFNGTGNQTINTGLGTTPTTVTTDCTTVSGSSQTIGFTNAQSSVVTTGAGLAWNGVAIKT